MTGSVPEWVWRVELQTGLKTNPETRWLSFLTETLSRKWKRARVVEWTCFENMRGCKVTGGSNPPASAKNPDSPTGLFLGFWPEK